MDIQDIEVTWVDCFGDRQVDPINDFINSYAHEQVGIEMAGEDW